MAQTKKVADLERNSIEIKYSKHMLHIKCLFKKAFNREKDQRHEQLLRAFRTFKLNSMETAMQHNLVVLRT